MAGPALSSSLKSAIPAGLVDAGGSSLATFAVGIFAARILDAESLGVYAVFFSGFTLAFTVPAYLVFGPAEVATLSIPSARRLLALPRTAPVGLGVAAISAVVTVMLSVIMAPSVDADILMPLAITSGCAALVWPLQDHVRQMLHMSRMSWAAAAVSGVHVVVVLSVLGLALLLDVEGVWIPFGALALGNVVSMCVVIVPWLSYDDRRIAPPSMRSVIRTGRFYLLFGAAPMAGGFVVAVIIGHLAGAAALGHAEAARIVAQPIIVVASGMVATMSPRLLEAGSTRNRTKARRLSALFISVLAGCGLLTVAVAGWQWPGSPIVALLPQAYVVPWLVTATVGANVVTASIEAYREQLLGASQERRVAKIEVVASVVQAAAACSAVFVGALARPLAMASQGSVQWLWLNRAARRLYDDDADGAAPTDTTAPVGAGEGVQVSRE